MKQLLRSKKVILFILFLVLLLPIGVPCGAFAYSCATPPTSIDGTTQRYSETEPLGITIIETIVGKNLKIYYSAKYVTVTYGN
jgi:hypothetical protein